MIGPAVWIVALVIGVGLTYFFAASNQIVSTVTAWALVCGIWHFSGLRFVAGRSDVSKMSTAWTTRYLRLVMRRLLLTLALALVCYVPVRSDWGAVYWLSIAAYYQVGIALTIREAWRAATPPTPPLSEA